jgi:hypothetical protein
VEAKGRIKTASSQQVLGSRPSAPPAPCPTAHPSHSIILAASFGLAHARTRPLKQPTIIGQSHTEIQSRAGRNRGAATRRGHGLVIRGKERGPALTPAPNHRLASFQLSFSHSLSLSLSLSVYVFRPRLPSTTPPRKVLQLVRRRKKGRMLMAWAKGEATSNGRLGLGLGLELGLGGGER